MRTVSLIALFVASVVACSSASDPSVGGSQADAGTGGSTSGGGSATGSGSAGGTGSGSASAGGTGSASAGGTATGGGTSTSGGTATAGGNGGNTGGGTDASTPSQYPAGPYGTAVGDVIANMTWQGYPDDSADAVATSKTYGSYSLDDARSSGRKYAMINLAESDCPGCQKSAGELQTGAKSVDDAGGIVIEVLETTGFVSQASKSDLDAWVNKYSLDITTVKDPDGSGTPTLDALGQREQAYIIDLSTMKIVQIIAGDISGIGATSGAKAMTAMHTLLGK